MILLDDFFTRAVLGGIGVALAAGPLGCFVVWRRMAYFGDTLAHSALLGVGLGIALSLNPLAGVTVVCVLIALAIFAMQRQRRYATDTVLGLLAHGTLATGLVIVSLLEGLRLDLLGYLFGDILAISAADIAVIYAGAAVILVVLWLIWRPLLAETVSPEIAHVESSATAAARLAFVLLMALIVAIAMQVVGLLLITSMLIIPAAAARAVSRTPEQMAGAAALLGVVAVLAGLQGSLRADTPAGPSVVAAALVLFVLMQGAGRLLARRRG